jgi:acetyltransferase
MEAFHRLLSPESVYRRYFSLITLGERIRHARLDRICHPDPDQELVMVVVTQDMQSECIIGVGRLSNMRDATTGELAVIVADAYQRQGIGTELVGRLIEAGRRRGLRQIRAEILGDNFSMQRICGKAGMHLAGGLYGNQVTAVMDL